MGSPRIDLVFRFWQCDKKNHGWREGPPVTVACQSFDLLSGPSPSRQNQTRTKKEYCFPCFCRDPLTQNIGRFFGVFRPLGRLCLTPECLDSRGVVRRLL